MDKCIYIVTADSSDDTISYGIDVRVDLLGVFSTYENAKSYICNLITNHNDSRVSYKYCAGRFLSLSGDGLGKPLPILGMPGQAIDEDDEYFLNGSRAVLDITEVPIDQQVMYRIANAFYLE